MEDIRHEDRRIFLRELFRPGRMIGIGLLALVMLGLLSLPWNGSGTPFAVWVSVYFAIGLIWALRAYKVSLTKRFLSRRFEALWNGCVDRLNLFEEVRTRMIKDRQHDWEEMPKTVDRVAKALYLALRRSDLIAHEVTMTEKGLYSDPPTWVAPSHDAQAKELYRIADKNIAEYRQQYAAVMAGVQRTEAQTAVFMTTVDTLRMKMIGHRLVGKKPEMSSIEFLEAMNEAKLQLAAIDSALHELELMPYPKTIAVMPPPIPKEAEDLLSRFKDDLEQEQGQ